MKKTKVISLLLGLCMVLGLVFLPLHSVQATEVNEKILDARKGVLQVAVLVKVDGQEAAYTHVGTGFLVGGPDGAQTVITNYHVAHALTEDAVRTSMEIPAESKVELSLSIIVKRDVRINASIINESAEADFSILKLEQPIYDREPLTLSDSDSVTTTQEVYALGFPGIVQDIQNDGIYTSDDVTVTSGIVSKTSDVVLLNSPIECITHSAQVTYGNSGGPLVDANGYVIGINTIMSSEEGNHDYFFSTKINEVREILDALGIEYMSADSDTPAETETQTQAMEETVDTSAVPAGADAQGSQDVSDNGGDSVLRSQLQSAVDAAGNMDLENMTEDSVANFNTAFSAAKDVLANTAASDDEISAAIEDLKNAQDGLLEKQGMNTTMIIIIAAVAVVVIVVVIVVIIAVTSSSKKKKAAQAADMYRKIPGGASEGVINSGRAPVNGPGPKPMNANPGWGPAPGFQQPPMGGQPPFSPGNDGSAETSVLNDGAGETTLLGGAGLPSAFLVRKKNNERVTISKQIFKIGRERRRVDYCISDNTNIGRAHADIVFRNGEFYIIDHNSTNGTSVNGVSVAGGQERKLNNGDVIKLADDEFVFQM